MMRQLDMESVLIMYVLNRNFQLLLKFLKGVQVC